MLVWIIAVAIALAVAAALAAPLLRRGAADAVRGAEDVEIYRDQMAEVERDLARGVLDPAEAERTRTEIARRLLAADRAGPAQLEEAPAGATRAVAVIAALTVAAGGMAGYAVLGRADLPDTPRAVRLAEADARLADLPTQAEAEAAAEPILAPLRITPPDDIAATVAALRAGLADNPDDLDALTLLRDFETRTMNFAAAVDMSAEILRVKGDAATTVDLFWHLELMVQAANGTVSAEAIPILERVAAMAPEHPAINYFRGLVFYTAGRWDLAFREWQPIADSDDPDMPFVDRVQGMMPDLAFLAGVEWTPPPLRGPTAEQIAAAGDMDPEARAEMIRGMVAGLSERLAAQGGTADEWAQLVTALGVLGETDRARAIWDEAQIVFVADPAGLEAIRAAAAGAGVAE